jgi:hypothetical protein
MATEVKIEGNKLHVIMDLNTVGQRSASGKTMVHASTHGNMATTAVVNGKPLVIGVNAYTK